MKLMGTRDRVQRRQAPRETPENRARPLVFGMLPRGGFFVNRPAVGNFGRLPSGRLLAEFAWQSGFVTSPLFSRGAHNSLEANL